MDEKIMKIIPNITKEQKVALLELFGKEINEAVRQAEWDASCGAYDQIMFSMKHGG